MLLCLALGIERERRPGFSLKIVVHKLRRNLEFALKLSILGWGEQFCNPPLIHSYALSTNTGAGANLHRHPYEKLDLIMFTGLL